MSGELDTCPFNNTVVGSPNLCTGDIEYSGYDYNVSVWQAALFVALFSVLTIIHTVQGVLSRKWWTLPSVALCAGLEVLGWSARLASATTVQWIPMSGGHWYSSQTPFLIQISVLIFSPAFLSAYYYILLGRLMKKVAPTYSRVNPNLYALVFCLGDLASLIVQAVGGGIASAADTLDGANAGARIMVGGVFAQMFFLILFCIVLADFVFRFYVTRRPVSQYRFRKSKKSEVITEIDREAISPAASRKVKLQVGALVLSTILLFVRSFYRCIELLQGWRGTIISNQGLFSILDGLMVFLAVAVFNFVHPLYFWPTTEEIGSIEKVSSQPMQEV